MAARLSRQGMTNNCICADTSNVREDKFYIKCENCGRRCHGVCVNICSYDARRIKNYYCPPCLAADVNLSIVFRKKRAVPINGTNEVAPWHSGLQCYIQKVVDRRVNNGVTEYLLKLLYYPESRNMWVQYNNMVQGKCSDMVDSFNCQRLDPDQPKTQCCRRMYQLRSAK